ncbi:Uu.00g038270.m01.CDS01 [Anthostomella pinea]|uniref:Uu.00g038270.m01.CDS01 n=1 Tax=Anthostomella pinea TaxID=933095 RepID=A0AAI8V9S1_9PEZI|nr:Uu.00g038270.m01.CDS01 [Anthostomella pinea]
MASRHYNPHPLPAPPPQQQGQQHASFQQQQPPVPRHHQPQPYQQHQSQPSQSSQVQKQERTRPKSRAFSFRSDKSQKSANSHQQKVGLQESSAEKESKRLHTHADPRMAMTEQEPAMQAQQEEIQMAPLRSVQHKDFAGNLISDPDRSNPTRNRWERPLDTIRSFEAAIDGGYNRNSVIKADTDSMANWNRRSSYYGNNGPRFPQDSYYGGRPASTMRPDSMMLDTRQSAMMAGPKDSYHDGFDGGPYGNAAVGPRNRYSRNHSEPYIQAPRAPADRNVYPMPNNHRSYETVATASGSGSMGEPAGYQTDPTSSENSSIDRRSPPKRQEPTNDYGISFGQSPTYQAPSFSAGNGQASTPPVTRKENGSMLRKPSKTAPASGNAQQRPEAGEKRKSWLLRRFSSKKS